MSQQRHSMSLQADGPCCMVRERARWPRARYQLAAGFRARVIRGNGSKSMNLRICVMSNLLIRSCFHAANTVRLSISEVGIFKRRRICAITQNCAEGFKGFRAPPESRVHSQVRLLTDTRSGCSQASGFENVLPRCPG